MSASSYDSPDLETEEAGRPLGETLANIQRVLVRRRTWIVSVGLGIFVLSLAVAALLPAKYSSSATILIQEQSIPPDLVRSTVTSYADERIQVISQQVLSRSVLLKLIEAHDLYASHRRYLTNEEILDRMRSDIKLTPVSADVTDPRSGAQVRATIAFKLAYVSPSADSAQKITNELVSLYLDENIKNREQRAAETSTFLEEETGRLSKHIQDVERQLADFKAKNEGRLPDEVSLNISLSERTDQELLRVEHDITELRDRLASYQSELALTSPNAVLPGPDGQKSVMDPVDQLRALKSQLVSLQGVYSDEHPDIRRIRREIASLEAQGYRADVDTDRAQRIDQLRANISELKQHYKSDHPDVVRAQAKLDALLAEPATEPARGTNRVRADNPIFLNLRSQIDSVNAQLQALDLEHKSLLEKQAGLQRRMEETPNVERGYLDLTRDMDNSRARFRELKEKEMEAQVAQQLEKDRKAERFTLIDPPQYPEKPASPNRPVIGLAGIFLALVGGLGAGALRETLDVTVRDSEDVHKLLRAPVLSVIPAVTIEEEVDARKRRARILIVALGILVVVLLGVVNFFFVPLEVLWFALLRLIYV